MRPMRRARTLSGVVAVGALFWLPACSTDTENSSPSAGATPSSQALAPGDQLSGDDLALTIATASKEAGTGKSQTDDGTRRVFDLSGPRHEYTTVPDIEFEMLISGEQSFSRMGDQNWDGPLEVDGDDQVGAQLVRHLIGVDVTYAGAETASDGTVSDVYKWTVPLGDFNDSLVPVNSDDNDVQLTLWVGKDDLPVQEEHYLPPVTVNGVQQRPLVRTRYFGWGEPVKMPEIPSQVAAPPAPSASASLGELTGRQFKQQLMYDSLSRFPVFANTDPRTLAIAGRSGCSGARRGAGFAALHSTAMKLMGLNGREASALVGSMLAIFCPEFEYLVTE